MIPRELPLVIVKCCTRYIVSEKHPVPRCHECGETPTFYACTTWWLELEPA